MLILLPSKKVSGITSYTLFIHYAEHCNSLLIFVGIADSDVFTAADMNIQHTVIHNLKALYPRAKIIGMFLIQQYCFYMFIIPLNKLH